MYWILILSLYALKIEINFLDKQRITANYFSAYLLFCFLKRTYESAFQKWKVAQSCLTLCNHMDCSPPGYAISGIF